MSTLSYCNLDDAFNSSTMKKKKKSKKAEYKLLERGADIDIDRPGAMPANINNANTIPFTYEQNDNYMKLQDENRQKAMDEIPNEKQKDLNQISIDFMNNIQQQIVNLAEQVNNLKAPQNVNPSQNSNTVESFTNNTYPNKNTMRFDNDQFNELLLYIFTGIFILIVIDYIFKLGKKSF